MTTPLSWLERVPSYKDQQQKLSDKDLTTYGFLGYPLLQSADILLYHATGVPVGEDQVPHIEITREIARRMNHLYQKPLLTEPKALLTPAAKMPGLDGQKMSKSYHNTITLRDAPETVSKKIKGMPTDPARIRRTDAGDPNKCPVWQLHAVYSDAETKAWAQAGCTTAGIGCLQCKQPIIDAINAELAPMQERVIQFVKRPDDLHDIMNAGAQRAKRVAEDTLNVVRTAMGLKSA
jgi:tryptophanyl-tRNA synthetase